MDKILVLITNDEQRFMKRKIPSGINEIELKGVLRDLGFIPTNMDAYANTSVYLLKEENNRIVGREEICTDDFRTLEELGMKDNALIRIDVPRFYERPTVVHHYHDSASMKCLYGCPMASSVEEAVNEAEAYNHENSVVKVESV